MRTPPRFPRPRALALLALALCAAGCAPQRADPWPDGALLVARSGALAQLLARLSELDGTPLGRRAAALAEALPDCPAVESLAPEAGGLWESLACASADGPLAALQRERGARAALFALPVDGGARLRGALELDASGGAQLTLTLPRDALRGVRALVVPGETSPGPGVLSSADALLHARVRPDAGLDVAALVPRGGQADRLFGLKSELFSSVVLDGTWEAALYLPRAGGEMPRAALALGVRQRGAAVAAARELVRGLARQWPLRESPFAVGAADGGCLLELNLLPELSPCWVATERALVLGWNPESVRKALDGGDTLEPESGGEWVVELDRFAAADALLAQRAQRVAPDPGARYPWSRLLARGARSGDTVELRVRLLTAAGA